jgi:hypothetical protein
VNRRDSVLALLALGATPLATLADVAPRKVYRIGFLWDSPTGFPDYIDAFRHRETSR